MKSNNITYTYRCGEKLELSKSENELVVRTLPNEFSVPETLTAEQVSSASTRFTTNSENLEALMSHARGIAPTHHAYYTTSGEEYLITDRIFVTFCNSITDAKIDAFAAKYGLIKQSCFGERDYLFQLTNHTGMNPVKLVVQLTENESLVELAENDLNQRAKTSNFSPPIDPAYARQWHLHTDFNHVDFDPRASSNCEGAWQLINGFGSEDVVIAVTDDGCKLNHHDFDSNNKFAAWGYLPGQRLITALDIDANPEQMYIPGANHGTSCAGVTAAETDAALTVGAAPGCRLLPIQWQSSGSSLFISDSKLLTVINFLSDKVDVISNSWGGRPTTLWAQPVINRISSLASTGGRRGQGIVFLWAAGNENCPVHFDADIDVPYDHGVEVQGGALVWVGVKTSKQFRNNLVGLPNVMHVAALASTGMRSHYSNYGPGIDVCAPSSNSHAYYRMSLRGLGVTTTTGEPNPITESFGGTSSATPLVAGIIGLVITANPLLTPSNIISLLKSTAVKDLNFDTYERTPPTNFDPNPNWDVSPIAPFDSGEFIDTGAEEGTWSPWFGHGKVDATAAVAAAIGSIPQTINDDKFNGESAPNIIIPDNRTNGIVDTITCNAYFEISEVKIRVDITHTYIGDLRITLISPNNQSVVLHNRTGGSANNLRKEYSLQTTPALIALQGQPSSGLWRIKVEDLAAADVGQLNTWSLNISGSLAKTVSFSESPGNTIPDSNIEGLQKIWMAEVPGLVSAIEVDLDVTHTFIGDLTVELKAPNHTSVLLHNRGGGSTNNIIKLFNSLNTPALHNFIGTPAQGDWVLKVTDRAGQDTGKLNRWGIKLSLVQ